VYALALVGRPLEGVGGHPIGALPLDSAVMVTMLGVSIVLNDLSTLPE